MNRSDIEERIIDYGDPGGGFTTIEDVMKALDAYCAQQCAAHDKAKEQAVLALSETDLQRKVCSICPNCVEEPCRLDTGDFCATCTDILKLVAQQCAAARIDELETLQKLHTRTHHQTVTDNVGNVYVDDSYAYISAYETQERIAHLRQADTTPKPAPHDHNAPDGAERNDLR